MKSFQADRRATLPITFWTLCRKLCSSPHPEMITMCSFDQSMLQHMADQDGSCSKRNAVVTAVPASAHLHYFASCAALTRADYLTIRSLRSLEHYPCIKGSHLVCQQESTSSFGCILHSHPAGYIQEPSAVSNHFHVLQAQPN